MRMLLIHSCFFLPKHQSIVVKMRRSFYERIQITLLNSEWVVNDLFETHLNGRLDIIIIQMDHGIQELKLEDLIYLPFDRKQQWHNNKWVGNNRFTVRSKFSYKNIWSFILMGLKKRT